MGKAILEIDQHYFKRELLHLPDDLAEKINILETSEDNFFRRIRLTVESELIPESDPEDDLPNLMVTFYQFVDKETGGIKIGLSQLQIALRSTEKNPELPNIPHWETRTIYENEEIKALIEAGRNQG